MKFLPKRAAVVSIIVVLSFVSNSLINKFTTAFLNAEWVEVAVTSQISVISYSYFSIIPIKIVTALALAGADSYEPLPKSQNRKKSRQQSDRANEQILIPKPDSKVKKDPLKCFQVKNLNLPQEFAANSNVIPLLEGLIAVVMTFLLFLLPRSDLYPHILKSINTLIKTRPAHFAWSCFFIGGKNEQSKNFKWGARHATIYEI